MEKWNMHAANKADTKGDIEEELNRLEIVGRWVFDRNIEPQQSEMGGPE